MYVCVVLSLLRTSQSLLLLYSSLCFPAIPHLSRVPLALYASVPYWLCLSSAQQLHLPLLLTLVSCSWPAPLLSPRFSLLLGVSMLLLLFAPSLTRTLLRSAAISILQGSPAWSDGRLRRGDQLLSLDHESCRGDDLARTQNLLRRVCVNASTATKYTSFLLFVVCCGCCCCWCFRKTRQTHSPAQSNTE